jgi:PAS domain S-box-containing protein
MMGWSLTPDKSNGSCPRIDGQHPYHDLRIKTEFAIKDRFYQSECWYVEVVESKMEEAGTMQSQSQVKLSERERQILILSSKGQTDQAIAQSLGISFATVGTYWGRIRGKLGPYNRTELVAKYVRGRASQAMDVLKVQNAQLVAELEEKSSEVQELQTGFHLFEAILQAAPDAIIVVDQEGFIRVVNQAAVEAFGYSTTELIGTHVRKLVPDRHQGDHDTHRREYMANPTRRRMGEHYGTPARRKDGSEFLAIIHLNSTTTPAGVMVTCIVRPLEQEEVAIA